MTASHAVVNWWALLPTREGGAYVYVDSGLSGTIQVKEGRGGRAYLAITSEHSGAFNNFDIRTNPTGLNYAYSPTFYMTATFNSSDLSTQYGGLLGVAVGVNVRENVSGDSRVLEQLIGLGQADWYFADHEHPHTVAWGNGGASKFGLGPYTLGDTVTLAMKIEEQLISGHYNFKAYAAVVPSSGQEPTWTEIAGEPGKDYTYSVDYIGLIVGGTDAGPSHPAVTHHTPAISTRSGSARPGMMLRQFLFRPQFGSWDQDLPGWAFCERE